MARRELADTGTSVWCRIAGRIGWYLGAALLAVLIFLVPQEQAEAMPSDPGGSKPAASKPETVQKLKDAEKATAASETVKATSAGIVPDAAKKDLADKAARAKADAQAAQKAEAAEKAQAAEKAEAAAAQKAKAAQAAEAAQKAKAAQAAEAAQKAQAAEAAQKAKDAEKATAASETVKATSAGIVPDAAKKDLADKAARAQVDAEAAQKALAADKAQKASESVKATSAGIVPDAAKKDLADKAAQAKVDAEAAQKAKEALLEEQAPVNAKTALEAETAKKAKDAEKATAASETVKATSAGIVPDAAKKDLAAKAAQADAAYEKALAAETAQKEKAAQKAQDASDTVNATSAGIVPDAAKKDLAAKAAQADAAYKKALAAETAWKAKKAAAAADAAGPDRTLTLPRKAFEALYGTHPEPILQSTFNQPTVRSKQSAISDELRMLIRGARPGSYIMIPIYDFSDERTLEELRQAHREGVHVQVIKDPNTADSKAWQALQKTLRTIATEESWAIECPRYVESTVTAGVVPTGVSTSPNAGGACLAQAEKNKMHTKAAFFSDTLNHKGVVFVTSANFKRGGSGDGNWNNSLTVFEDPILYRSSKDYFDTLKRHATGSGDGKPPVGPNAGLVTPYYSPQLEVKPDPVLGFLQQVECNVGGKRATVEVAMSSFNRTDIASELSHMAGRGCNVAAVVRDDGISGSAKSTLQRPSGSYDMPKWVDVRSFDKDAKNPVHSKYLAVDGVIDGTPQKVVWTGSFNYTDKALSLNDEMLLRIDDPDTYEGFHDNFEALARAVDTGK